VPVVPDEVAPDEVVPEDVVPEAEETPVPEPEEPLPEGEPLPEEALVPEPEEPLPEEETLVPEERLPEETPVPEPPADEAAPDPDALEPDAPEAPRAEDDADRPAEPIPEEQWEERDLSLLEGCWTLISDYGVTRRDTLETIRVTDWEMCFERNGAGRQTLVFEDGTRCESGIGANFEGEALNVIDGGHVRCSDGSAINQRVMRCERQPDGTADCITRHVRPPEAPVPVRFQR